MADKANQVAATLKAGGFELVRQNKHLIYRNAKGKTLTTSATPSDRRASRNQLREIRRAMSEPTVTTGAVDAILPKHEKARVGAKRPANVFDFYSGIAPRSILATPEAMINMLQGHLRSRDAYRFKSELTKEVCRFVADVQRHSLELVEECMRDFEKIWIAMKDRTLMKLSEEAQTDKQKDIYVTFFTAAEIVHDENDCDGSCHDSILQVLKATKAYHVRTDSQFRSVMAGIAGRAANHLLRGQSAAEVRAVIQPQIEALHKSGGLELVNCDMADLIERIAVEKIALEKTA